MLSCAFFFHQADRALFGLLTIPIQKDIGLTDVQIGWINTTLSWTLAAMTVIAGFVGDRFSRKWIITLSLIAWSLMTVCMGFVGGFAGALFFRSIATGVGESFYAPSAYALIAVHHKETRSVALSIHQAALYVGLMVSGLVVAWALGFLGSWRNVFIAFGVAGCALGVVFVWLLRDNANDSNDSRISRPSGTSSLSSGLKAYFCNPSALCATAGFVAIVFVNNAYLFWAPKFAAEKFALDVGVAGRDVMLWHHLLAFAAILAGGVLTDKFVRRFPRFRLGFQVLALLSLRLGQLPERTIRHKHIFGLLRIFRHNEEGPALVPSRLADCNAAYAVVVHSGTSYSSVRMRGSPSVMAMVFS